MNTMKETFVNETCNDYREKFHSCLKSWKMGAITGVLVAAALSFLFSGFQRCIFGDSRSQLLGCLVRGLVDGVHHFVGIAFQHASDHLVEIFGVEVIP